MPRGRRRIVSEKNYDELIQKTKEKIDKLAADLKAEKSALKELEKDKAAFEKQKESEEMAKKKKELMEIIKQCGKSPEEIRALLFPE